MWEPNSNIQDRPNNLFGYNNTFRPVLHKAKEDEATFKHVINVVVIACASDDQRKVIDFLHRSQKDWEFFLTITVPLYMFNIATGKCLIEYHFLVRSVLSILDCTQENSVYFRRIASELLPYLEVALNHLGKIIPGEINGMKDVLKNLKVVTGCGVKSDVSSPGLVDPLNFRNLSIIPSSKDIYDETPLLEPSIINGNFNDVEHYLSLCFRLNREDMMYGMRKGLAEYKGKLKNNANPTSTEYVRVYQPVKLDKAPSYNIRGKLFKFEIKMRKDVEWKETKRMKPGNILCFSSDNFQTMTFVSIVIREPFEGKGNACSIFVKVESEDLVQDLSIGKVYVILEPENYFEAYRHGLQILKALSADNFPLSEYIVKPKAKVIKPDCSNCDDGVHDFFRTEGLDSNQKEAAVLALSSPISLIQGPPGTGKTYVALKILKYFLRTTEVCPVVIICYSNHALDKFLEGVLQFNKKVIRMGRQSDSEKLKPHFINNITAAVGINFFQKKEMCLELKRALEVAQEIIPKSFPYNKTSVLRSKNLKKVINELDGKQSAIQEANTHFLRRNVLDSMLNETFKHMLMKGSESSDIVHSVKDWLKGFGSDDREIADNVRFICKVMSDGEDQYSGLVCKTENNAASEFPVRSNDPWDLPAHQRIQRFALFKNRYLNKLFSEVKSLEDYHNTLIEHISKTDIELKYEYLRNADVIGFTTTGAAINRKLLEMLKPKIIIVEEAAEIQEMHVISSIPNSVEHLILIGDHEQLKPIPACFHLGKDFNLNVSLFERLFKNRIPSVRLEVQRRMRPSICRLLVPTIYRTLINHSVVSMYENIRGMNSNVFFLRHMEPEVECITEKTHMNFHEATFVVALTHYLVRMQCYETHRITVLSLYSGQQKLLKKIFALMSLDDIEVVTVDGFQGEENHIVIISFVRSNDNEGIGFLNSSNRVCVALSRAMGGLYCIGNFELYSNKEAFWNNLLCDLKRGEEYGEQMPMCISGNTVNVKNAKDFIETCSSSERARDGICDHEFFTKLSNLTMSEILKDL